MPSPTDPSGHRSGSGSSAHQAGHQHLQPSCQSFPWVTSAESFSPPLCNTLCLVPAVACPSDMCHLARWPGKVAPRHVPCAGVAQSYWQSIPGHRLWLSGSWLGTNPSCCRGSTSLSWQESDLQSNLVLSPLGSSDKGRQEEGQQWPVGHKGCELWREGASSPNTHHHTPGAV